MPPVSVSPISSPSTQSTLATNVIGASNIVLAPNRDTVVRVGVYVGGVPVGGARVEFQKDNSTAPDALLGSDSLLTANDGTVSVRVRAGSQNGSFDVVASTEGSAPVRIHVTVASTSTGGVVARAGYSGTATIDHIDYRLHDGRVACRAFDSPYGLPATYAALQTPGTAADARFNNLTASTPYIVTAIAVDARGQIVASGCASTTVVEQRDTVANIPLTNVTPPAAPSFWQSVARFFGF